MGYTNKIAPGNAVQGVAGSANLTVDLISSPDAAGIHQTRAFCRDTMRSLPGMVKRVEQS